MFGLIARTDRCNPAATCEKVLKNLFKNWGLYKSEMAYTE